MNQKKIYCTVTNDLNQDQRMHRICTTLTELDMQVHLIGTQKKHSKELMTFPFVQKRLNCYFEKGFLFYTEYNIRLFLFLLFSKVDIIYSVDLDTILPGYLIKKWKNINQIFDAHEYFTEVPELQGRSFVKSVWIKIENYFVPKADLHITVSQSLSDLFTKKFRKPFSTIRNIPYSIHTIENNHQAREKFIVYIGMLNKGRGLEAIIGAMEYIPNVELKIIGVGDISDELISLANKSKAKERIKFLGWMNPTEMAEICSNASLGINLLESESLSYYYSLANKFFDYINYELPSVNMDFPEYKNIINQIEVGIFTANLIPNEIAESINELLNDQDKLYKLRTNCKIAKSKLNWENESKNLIQIIQSINDKSL